MKLYIQALASRGLIKFTIIIVILTLSTATGQEQNVKHEIQSSEKSENTTKKKLRKTRRANEEETYTVSSLASKSTRSRETKRFRRLLNKNNIEFAKKYNTEHKKVEPRTHLNETHTALTSKHCSDFISGTAKNFRRRKRKHNTRIKTAYRMAVLATLAYWEKAMPEGVSGFSLLSDTKPTRSLREGNKILRIMKSALCSFQNGLFSIRHYIEKYLLRVAMRIDRTREKLFLASRKPRQCRHHTEQGHQQNDKYTFEYLIRNWHEPTAVPKVNWHDTDLLVSTSGENVMALAFAGTSSAADHFTNIQTFEPAEHSGFFHEGNNNTIEGSLHRGFLNAYSRVERGSIVRLCQNCTDDESISDLTHALNRRYGHCVDTRKKPDRKQTKTAADDLAGIDTMNSFDLNRTSSADNVTRTLSAEQLIVKQKSFGCHSRGEKLVMILRELVNNALLQGKVVHLTGHSQGAALATLLALDIIINFPQVPIRNLHIWSFGAPQAADDVFVESAIKAAPRLGSFLKDGRRFHRFVTLSDKCEVDIVTNVTSKALPSHKTNLRGRAARHLGGVSGSIVHFSDPYYLLTPEQHGTHSGKSQSSTGSAPADGDANNSTENTSLSSPPSTKTKSTLAAHHTVNYLHGISRESSDHPLVTDLPPELRKWLGDDITTELPVSG